MAGGGSHRFSRYSCLRVLFFFCGNEPVKQQSDQITAALRGVLSPVVHQAISVVDGGSIADNCGEFIHFHYLSS